MCKSNLVSRAIRGGYVSFPSARPENPQIIDAVLKRLSMILYALKYAFQTHSIGGLVILYHFSFLIL